MDEQFRRRWENNYRFNLYNAGITRAENQKPLREIDLGDAYELIRGDRKDLFKIRRKDETGREIVEQRSIPDLVSELRSLQTKEERDAFKKERLPFFTFRGVFSRRKKDELLAPSDLFCIDIDHIGGEEAEALKEKMNRDELLGAKLLFLSPTGTGLKVVIGLNPHIELQKNDEGEDDVRSADRQIKRVFAAVQFYLSKYYPEASVNNDDACKDICRACFASYDPAAKQGTLTYFDWMEWEKKMQKETGEIESFRRSAAKAEDPTIKKGIVGAFCRAYDIHEAISTFLPHIYEPFSRNRYSYTQSPSKSKGGLVVYENGLHAFSNHGTDPARGRGLNAWDLVRIHLFDGELDDGSPDSSSYKRLEEYCQRDERVQRERLREAEEVFGPALNEPSPAVKKPTPEEMFGHLLKTTSEAEILKAESQLPEALRTGFWIRDIAVEPYQVRKIDPETGKEKKETEYKKSEYQESFELELSAAALTGFVAATNHGKTALLLNLILNVARRYPEKKFIFLTYEERENKIIQYLLNIYLRDLVLAPLNPETKRPVRGNRRCLRNYFKYGNTDSFDQTIVPEFKRRKEAFFKEFIETGRILIKGVDSCKTALLQQLQFLSRNGVGGVFVDYFQLILQDPKTKWGSRQEELKDICLALKDVAISTGLPVVLAAQFNREVLSPDDMIPQKVREAADIEQILSEMYGIWDLHKEAAKSNKKLNTAIDLWCGDRIGLKPHDSRERALLIRVLKGRDIPTGLQDLWEFERSTTQKVYLSKEKHTSEDEHGRPITYSERDSDYREYDLQEWGKYTDN